MSEIDLNAPEVQEAIKNAVDEATKGLKKNNLALLADLKKAQKDTVIDPEDYNRLKEENESLSEKINEAAKANKQFTAEIEKYKKAALDESAYSSSLLVETRLNDALSSVGIKPEFNKAVKAMFLQQAQVIADQEGRSVKIGDKAATDFIKEWAETDEGKAFILAPLNIGGGSHGGGSGQGKKIMSKSDFRALTPHEKITFAREGGQITE